jgi:hypothetical protein
MRKGPQSVRCRDIWAFLIVKAGDVALGQINQGFGAIIS